MLTTARRNAKYTMWFTHRLPRIDTFVANDRANNTRNYDVKFIANGELSLKVNLDGPLPF